MSKYKRKFITWLGLYDHRWENYYTSGTGGKYYYCKKCGKSIYLPTDWQPISRHKKGCAFK